MKKIFSIGALSLALIMGMSSCSKEKMGPEPTAEGNTYASVSISVNGSALRAEINENEEEHNYIGEWAGQDVIDKVAVYIVDNNVVSVGKYSKTDFTITPTQGDGNQQIVITPKKAIKTTAGTKTVYVLINGTDELEQKLALTDPAAFKKVYAEEAYNLKNSIDKSKTPYGVSTSADKIAAVNSDGYDRIVMTNSKEVSFDAVDKVKEDETLASGAGQDKNRYSVEVKRAAARVLVTTKAEKFNITDKNSNEVLGEISDIKWVVGQSESALFLQQKPKFVTPKFEFVPVADTYKEAIGVYDYSGLWREYDSSKAINGNATPLGSKFTDPVNDTELIAGKVKGEFVLPTTHAMGDTRENTGFRKGNSVYVLIRAQFTPKKFADTTEAYVSGSDFYVGDNDKFYSTLENAQNPEKGGVKDQKVRKYVKGKVLYWAWVNPDQIDPANWLNSPVLRNNIYHINITGFKSLGWNWNPLVPNDPGKPDNPENPDPKPENPNEPDTPPVKPEDPLSTPETWMSVDVKVLPWKVHSYDIDLSI